MKNLSILSLIALLVLGTALPSLAYRGSGRVDPAQPQPPAGESR